MACVNKSNTDNFLIWNKVAGSLTLAQLQASGMPSSCDNVSIDTPSNLATDNPTVSTIDLSWESFSNTIEIYRSADNNNFTLVDTLTNSETSYTDTGLSTGTTYYYKIRSVGFISSPYSNVAIGSTTIDFYAAIYPDGVDNYMEVNGINSETFNDTIAFSFWIKFPSAITGGRQIFTAYDGAGDDSLLMLRIDEVSPTEVRVYMEVYDTLGLRKSVPHIITLSSLPEWNLFNFQMAPTGGSFEYDFKVGINGVEVASDTVTFSASLQTNYGDCSFFTNTAKTNRWCDFPIDQFACIINQDIFNDLESIWNSGQGMDLLNFYDSSKYKFYYSFDEGVPEANNTAISSPEIVDDTGNGFTATLFNFAKTGTISNWVNSLS